MTNFSSTSDRHENQEILLRTPYNSQEKLSCKTDLEEARSSRHNGGMGGGTI